jgi:opine dehydrogenase
VGSVAVLGAGNGGLAALVDLTLRGEGAILWNRNEATIAPLRDAGRLDYSGVLGSGSVVAPRLTVSLAEAVADATAILVCLPAFAHDDVARSLAPHLRPGQRIVLDPGGMLGSLAFARELRAAGYAEELLIGETATLSYIARKAGPSEITISHVLHDLPFAALPGEASDALAADLVPVLPFLAPSPEPLSVGLASVNTVLHPPAMILGAAWIEATGGDFTYYYDAATPAVGRLMARIDDERLAVARAWGCPAGPFLEVFAAIGSTTSAAAASGDFRRALRESAPNRWIQAPPNLEHRYLREDIPFGVVPLAELGRAARVATPVLDAIITVASAIAGLDFRASGRNLTRLGIEGLGVDEVRALLASGRP